MLILCILTRFFIGFVLGSLGIQHTPPASALSGQRWSDYYGDPACSQSCAWLGHVRLFRILRNSFVHGGFSIQPQDVWAGHHGKNYNKIQSKDLNIGYPLVHFYWRHWRFNPHPHMVSFTPKDEMQINYSKDLNYNPLNADTIPITEFHYLDIYGKTSKNESQL